MALGGEVGPSTAYLLEAAPPGHRGFVTSWQIASQGCAALLAGLVSTLLALTIGDAAMNQWGWRVMFLLGLTVVPVGLIIRSHLPETAGEGEDPQAAGSAREVVGRLLRDHWRLLGLTFLVIAASTVSNAVGTNMPVYAGATLGLSETAATAVPIALGLASVAFPLLGGWLADRFGRRPVMIWPRAAILILAVPAFLWLLSTPGPAAVYAVTFLLSALSSINAAAIIVGIPEALPRSVRSTGLALVYALSVSLFGGSTNFIINWLVTTTGDRLAPAYYLAAFSLVGTIAAMLLPETKDRSLDDESAPAAAPPSVPPPSEGAPPAPWTPSCAGRWRRPKPAGASAVSAPSPRSGGMRTSPPSPWRTGASGSPRRGAPSPWRRRPPCGRSPTRPPSPPAGATPSPCACRRRPVPWPAGRPHRTRAGRGGGAGRGSRGDPVRPRPLPARGRCLHPHGGPRPHRPLAGRGRLSLARPGGWLAEANPHRVFLTRIGRIEVFTPWQAGPEGPHARLVPEILRAGRSHAATAPIPPGLVPCGALHPPHPAKDGAGRAIPFVRARHEAFQAILDAWGDPALVAAKRAAEAGRAPPPNRRPQNRRPLDPRAGAATFGRRCGPPRSRRPTCAATRRPSGPTGDSGFLPPETSRLSRRLGLLAALLVVGNVGAWLWAWSAFAHSPTLLSTALLAYVFGLRHAVDPDHIAAIDNVTRKLLQAGQRPVSVGLWFALAIPRS